MPGKLGATIEIPSGSPFTLQNIPFGVISTADSPPRCATAIGNYAIDLEVYYALGHLSEMGLGASIEKVFSQSTLNAFAALPPSARRDVRRKIIEDIKDGTVEEECLVPLASSTSNMSAGSAIPKNWFYAPSVYNSRVSSVVASPQPIRRPRGLYFKDGDDVAYGPSQQMDYELEMGYFVSQPVAFGSELGISKADEHIFGFVLLNDWSARDLQMFEMKPLGPFHGKGFGTSISPWIVTMDALEPFRCAPKTQQDPPPFDHLRWPGRNDGAINISLRVTLLRNGKRYILGTSNLKYLYWTPFQQITHHASAMCGLQTGDLLGTGTISGDAIDVQGNKKELGCLYEATQAGTQFVTLDDGTRMKYLEDEDEIVLEGWCTDKNGEAVLGFGDCRGRLLPALRD
ncbi:hypothetical protein BDV12DRAFT_203884 [Aspergillus spectabilis]